MGAGAANRGRRLIRELVSGQAGPARRIVDVGTGVGSLMPDILAAFPQASLVGIDRSAGMLALAPRDRGMLRAVADARQLPLASGGAVSTGKIVYAVAS